MARRQEQGARTVGGPRVGRVLDAARTGAAADPQTVPDGLARTAAGAAVDPVTPGGALAFPDLGGADEKRMEDIVAARLFPRRATPQRIGRYTIIDRLGQGGMGVVYAAYDPELDRRVAIKLLTETLAGQAEARLLREAQAMARVVHANVVSVIEVGVHDGRAFVVMEYVRGISLDRWQQRPRHWRDTLRVYVQAGRGLAAAHRAGVIHRDFKPHNAMLVEGGVDDGRVKVLDFGLARAALDASTTPAPVVEAPTGALALPLTRTGAMMGTPAYMAPERLAGRPASERSDQFGFAVSLYEALHGQLPFAGASLSALMAAVATAEIRPPPAGSPVPAWVHRVVVRGLARAPEDRFESMTALCDALERDPGARRRTVGLALALSAVVGGGGWGLARLAGAPSPCTGPAFELSEVWNDARAAAVSAAFAATDLPYAADTARRVRPILDAYAEGWTTMRREACEVHRRGEQSAPLLDSRMACLDRRRAGFAALAGLLAGADAAVVERAVEASLALPGLAACADVAVLTAEAPPPDEPAAAHAVERVRARLAQIGAQLGAGRVVAAADAGEEALRQAEAVGFAPAIAEAALVLGTIQLERGRGDDAERALTIAVRQGVAGRADRVVAEALARRLFVRGVLLARSEQAAADEELAEVYAARFTGDGDLRWLHANNRGAVAYHRGDIARAREFYAQALAVADGPTPLESARTRVNLGVLAADARDYGTALAAYRGAGEQAAEVLGEQHPLVAQLRMYEGFALVELGRHAEARRRLEAALARQVDAGAEETPFGLWTRIYLSRLEARLGRYAAAREQATRALALASDPIGSIHAEVALADALVGHDEALARYSAVYERCVATYGADSAMVLGVLPAIGAGVLRVGRVQEALPIARRWVELARSIHGADAVTTARGRRLLADVLLARGEAAEALVEARAALATLEAQPGERPVDRALARWTLGRALLATGDPAGAVDVLRGGVELTGQFDADAPEAVALQDELARALATVGPL